MRIFAVFVARLNQLLVYHPNIVNIYDVGQDGDNHYLVMEMVKGKTLKEYIKEHGPLPLDEAIDIAKQIVMVWSMPMKTP